MMTKLITASQAGVKIDMIVRGICCLIPGVKGYTDNIKIISVVDRFLAHARVYIFANAGDEKMFIASADWMSRNLDQRVEAVIPILDGKIKKELRYIVNLQLQDNQKARRIETGKENTYIKRQEGAASIRCQTSIYTWLKGRGNH